MAVPHRTLGVILPGFELLDVFGCPGLGPRLDLILVPGDELRNATLAWAIRAARSSLISAPPAPRRRIPPAQPAPRA
jgi:hypothetical protein